MIRSAPMTRCAVAAVALLIAATGLQADTFYVDPVSGSAGGDGSAGNPWRTL